MRDVFANHWRRWLTGRLHDGHLKDRQFHELCGSDVDNPDQRISDDINTLTSRRQVREPMGDGRNTCMRLPTTGIEAAPDPA